MAMQSFTSEKYNNKAHKKKLDQGSYQI